MSRILTHRLLSIILHATISATAIQSASGEGELSSQTFYKKFLPQLTPSSTQPTLHLACSDSYSTPSFKPHRNSWEKEITQATWIHHSLSSTEESPKTFQSSFFLPISYDLLKFHSTLPILVIDTLGHPSPKNHHYQDCFWGIISPSVTAPFPGEFTESGRGGVKRRGSSSRFQRKFPMRLELRNWSGKDRPSSLLGLSASSDWILSPPSDRDPSLLRNPFMYTLSRDCGQYAPQSRFVEVFLNSRNRQLDQRADYFGVYSLTEKIQAGKGRLQLDPDPSSTANPLGLSQGIIFKFDRPGPGEKGLKIPNQDSEVFLTSPQESELSFQDSQILQQILGDFSLALNSPDRRHPRSQKSALDYIDSPSWHTWRWLGELSKNVDLYRASSYFHIPLSGPSAGLIKAGPVWDFDRSLNSKDRRDDDPHGWTAGKTWLPDRPIGVSSWWTPLLSDPTFKIEHCKHWQTLRKGPLSRENLEKRLTGLQRELSEKITNPAEGTLPISAFQRNTRRWPGTGPVGISLASEVTLISEWLQKRLAWIDHQVALVLGSK